MLMHGVIHFKVPAAVQKMGRLPFDLSSFNDGHSISSKTWGFNPFIREYFAFLDKRAVVWFQQENKKAEERPLMVQQLLKLQKWQSLLDMLLQIRPRADNMKVHLILEAMDSIIIEIFNVYSRICSEIEKVLMKVYSFDKLEAAMALKILQKATTQGEELYLYFEFCKEYGVLNANEFPTVTEIPEEDVQELERIIDGVSEKTYEDDDFKEKNRTAIAVREDEHRETKGALKTIITDKWEVFDENIKINGENISGFYSEKNTAADQDGGARSDLPLLPINHLSAHNHYEIPDLINF